LKDQEGMAGRNDSCRWRMERLKEVTVETEEHTVGYQPKPDNRWFN